jgi:glucosamine 6-phosphate synthetase-like amidotransferase/phosphosugar isomerase protein
MLHTRQGTAGEKNSINAQPIIADKVVLTHNGGVTNIEDLCKAYKIKHKDKLSDSNELAKILSIAKNKGKVLGEAQGTLRLAYFDMEANELMLFNDSYRSCSIKMAYDKEEDLMLYTNEESFIDPYYTEFKYYFGGLFRESVQGYKPNLLTRIMDENEAIKFELKNNKIKRYAMVTEEESKNEAKSSEDFVEWRSKNGEVMGYVKKSVMNDIKEAKEQNKLKADEASDELDFWNSKENQSNFGGGGA